MSRTLVTLVVVSAMTMAECSETRTPIDEPPPAANNEGGDIVFVSDRETRQGRFQIFVMAADGSGVRRLTRDANTYSCPQFSPDGKHILFHSVAGPESEIYLIDPSGSSLINLTHRPGCDRLPQYSPDGSRIAFMSDRDGNTEIYVMNSDGSDQRRLTFNMVTDHSPRWMPDGRRVVFFATAADSSSPGNPESYDLFTIDADGSSLRKLTPDNAYHHFSVRENSRSILDAAPRCSPDGRWIVFQHYLSGAFLISMISADGSLRVPLVFDSGVDFAPWFYPDGSQILFRSHRSGDFDLFRIPADGGGEALRVTNDTGHTMFGAFSDDGSRMLYVSNIDEERHEYYHIYVADADGGRRVKLTSGPFTDDFPAFRPGSDR